MVMLLVIVVPVSVYAVLPRGLLASGLNPLGIRTLPGREPNRYFLWPASRGDYGALAYSRAALAGLPTNSVLIADHTPLEPLRYAQAVDSIRRDVQLVKVEPMEDLGPVLSSISPQTAVFIADNNPDYYALDSLRGACAVPFGNVYQLVAGISPDLCE
jgi:hypothetical protein